MYLHVQSFPYIERMCVGDDQPQGRHEWHHFVNIISADDLVPQRARASTGTVFDLVCLDFSVIYLDVFVPAISRL